MLLLKGIRGIPVSYFSVRVGSQLLEQGGTVIKVSRVIQHPSFNPSDFDFDFAILQLATILKFNGITITSIPLPQATDVIADSIPVLVSGWGYTQSADSNKVLRAIVIPTMNQSKCNTIYQNDGGVTARMVCAASPGKDSCNVRLSLLFQQTRIIILGF